MKISEHTCMIDRFDGNFAQRPVSQLIARYERD